MNVGLSEHGLFSTMHNFCIEAHTVKEHFILESKIMYKRLI